MPHFAENLCVSRRAGKGRPQTLKCRWKRGDWGQGPGCVDGLQPAEGATHLPMELGQSFKNPGKLEGGETNCPGLSGTC